MSIIQSFFTLRPAFPEFHASVDFRNQRDLLIRIDAILTGSTMEHELIYDLMRRRGDRDYPKVFNRHLQGLRCCILRHLMGGLDFREFAFRLADSVLLQWFTLSAPYGMVNPPAKSTLERYNKNFSKELIESLIYELTLKAASPDSGELQGEPDSPLNLDTVFADCTCLQANIHHPVDWVLLRDGVRTLMGAIKLIRREGLCHRMEKPEAFLYRINELCMEMSAVGRKPDSKKRRKKVLRKMKKLANQVESHGWRYWKMLNAEWENTAWSRAQTDQVLERMETVLFQMPMARRQAHERIIGERKVPNDEKILSLYEPDIHVVVRGKAGAEVEFGNKLYLAEQVDGVIVDWKLYKERVPSDSKLVKES
jgi:IS5 family transposase